MLLVMNLQHCVAAGQRIRLELATLFQIYMKTSGSSLGTFFGWRGGQVDGESIQLVLDDVCPA